MKIFANNMLKGFCRFVLGKICDINIAYLGTKLIKKTQRNDMSFGSSGNLLPVVDP